MAPRNKVREFKPDFVFWLQNGSNYFIVFIDPKGTEHTSYQRKIDGYHILFEEKTWGAKKATAHDGKTVKVIALLYTADIDGLPLRYKNYWFDDIDKALATLR